MGNEHGLGNDHDIVVFHAYDSKTGHPYLQISPIDWTDGSATWGPLREEIRRRNRSCFQKALQAARGRSCKRTTARGERYRTHKLGLRRCRGFFGECRRPEIVEAHRIIRPSAPCHSAKPVVMRSAAMPALKRPVESSGLGIAQ